MPEFEVIKALLQQASATGTKSTVLKPLGWIMAILLSANLSAFYLKAPLWLGILFSIFSSLGLVFYLFAYVYCLLNDRDALRSETYSIQKLAIQKGFVGDDKTGKLPYSTLTIDNAIASEVVMNDEEVQ